jgi:glycosyltransferase involved in cell wall biosynthesis
VRVLYLTDRLSDRGGADHHLAAVVRETIRHGVRASVAYGRIEGRSLLPQGMEAVRVKALARAVDVTSDLDRVPGLAEHFDLVHLQNVMNPTAIEAGLGGGRAVITIQDHRVFCPGPGMTMPDGSRCRVTMSDADCTGCLPDALYRRATIDLTRRRLQCLAGAELIVLSAYMAGELARAGLSRLTVLPPWVETSPPKIDPGSSFLIAGRLVAHKGVVDGWLAWRDAGKPLPLEVAGAGPLEHEFEGARMLGWLPPDDLRSVLRRSRALIFPPRWQEPFGILGVEALAVGTPVIAVDRGGIGDWSTRGCIVVPPNDRAALTEAVMQLAADPERALHLGREGQSAIEEKLGREVLASKLLRLYRRVAAA